MTKFLPIYVDAVPADVDESASDSATIIVDDPVREPDPVSTIVDKLPDPVELPEKPPVADPVKVADKTPADDSVPVEKPFASDDVLMCDDAPPSKTIMFPQSRVLWPLRPPK